MKRRILCFGDSNTYGYDPMTGGRFDEDSRWGMAMQKALGEGYRVVEEGLNGRTFSQDDPTEGGHRSGVGYLPACLMSHNPIDVFCVMLGTNDTKERFNLNASTIAGNLTHFVRTVREYAFDANGRHPKILIISPPLIGDIAASPFLDMFGIGSVEKAKGFASHYSRYAKLLDCDFLDAAQFTKPCKVDAIHLSSECQVSLGKAVAEKVKEILKREV